MLLISRPDWLQRYRRGINQQKISVVDAIDLCAIKKAGDNPCLYSLHQL